MPDRVTTNRTIRRHFADEKVDVAVVETGMGGLTDATNIIMPEKLEAAVITLLGEACFCQGQKLLNVLITCSIF